MKIVSKGNTISTPEFRTKKMKARRKHLSLVWGLSAFLLVAFIAALHLTALRIQSVSVTGADATGADAVENIIRQEISGSYLWIFPKNSALLYPERVIEAKLLATFPRLSVADVSLDGLSTLAVDVLEREPFALYCASACSFLDESGFIFDKAPTFSDGVYFIYTDMRREPKVLGEAFLPTEAFAALAAFVRKIHNLGITPVSLAMYEDRNTLLLTTGATLLWQEGVDVNGVYADLEAFLGSEAIQAETNFWGRVVEVDLRTPNKVFYRFRE